MYTGLPPLLDLALIIVLAVACVINFALFNSPRINGGDDINAARLLKAAGFGMLAGWYGYKLYLLGDVRVSAIAAVAIAGIAFADVFAGMSRLGAVATHRPPPSKTAEA